MAEKPTKQQYNCIPPVKLQRNEFGLLTNVNYTFEDNSFVNWRKMVKTEYLFPNKSRTKETDVSKLEDKDLLITLAGLKELAQLRGYNHAVTHVTDSSNGVIANCEIEWIANNDTEGRVVSSSGSAKATQENTESFTKKFLAEIAENRAFARCIRNFLKINIVSKEEVGGNDESSKDNTSNLLKDTLAEFNIPWEKLKEQLIKENFEGAENFTSINDIPTYRQYTIIGRIRTKHEAKV